MLNAIGLQGVGVHRFVKETLPELRALGATVMVNVCGSSIDEYAAVRTLYGQFRASEIRNGAPADLEDIYDEDLYDEPDAQSQGMEDPYADPEAADVR